MLKAALTVLLALAVAGCGGDEPRAGTRLTMVALNSSVGRAVFRLECSPAGGDFPKPAEACAALEAEPALVTNLKPFTCIGGTFSWWEVTISGRVSGEAISRNFATCWTPQMETLERFGLTWEILQRHLVPRRHEAIAAGTSRVFAPGVLRATDLVTCRILDHDLEIGVPVELDQPASVGFDGVGVVSVSLQVTHERDGSVSATCQQGSP